MLYVLNFIHSIVQDMNLTEEDVEFIAKVTVELRGYLSCLDKIKWVYTIIPMGRVWGYTLKCRLVIPYRIRDGLRHILSVSRLGNIHMQENKPWVLVKGSAEDRYAK
jgi:methionyl-tRNA synthetase